MQESNSLWHRWKIWWVSAGAGALLGCLFRLIFSLQANNAGQSASLFMTLAFMVVVPFVMGYIAVKGYLQETPPESIAWYEWLFLPWAAVILSLAIAVAIKWEGFICVIVASPLLLLSSLIGGLIARGAWEQSRRNSPGIVSAIAFPLLFLIVELQVPRPFEIRTVNTSILIHAPAATVWDNIKSVRAIDNSELPSSWINHIGFPKPIAATLSHPGIGGVRQASFTGGLLFTETVNRWTTEADLRFSIHANTSAIPATTLDQHVTVGGAFFDVLDGEYRLEPTPDGILLHLVSHERLSTHFNPYAAAWTDAVMRAIQQQILIVIKNRCESVTPPQ
jgi:hypothetical protein